jgi:hypothetical protein
MKRLNYVLVGLLMSISIAIATSSSFAAEKPAEMKKSADLRPAFEKWGLDARVQGDRGTCSVFAITAVLEYAVASKQQRGARLSVEFLNWAANEVDKTPVDGGTFSELWAGYAVHGVCPEADMPYRRHFRPDRHPSEIAFAHAKETLALGLQLHWIKEWDSSRGAGDEQLAEIKRTLARGWPVCGGFLWPKNEGPLWKDGVLQMCPRSDIMDGHSVLLVGFRDDKTQPGGGVFLIRNSGSACRDSMLSYEYIRTYMNDAAWIDFAGATEGGPRP